jgi:hypothetical protein
MFDIKSSRAVSGVSVELKTNALDTSSVRIDIYIDRVDGGSTSDQGVDF